jgi:hypothetical protein
MDHLPRDRPFGHRPGRTVVRGRWPETQGGSERVVSFPTEELVAFGHGVVRLASGDSVRPWLAVRRSLPTTEGRAAGQPGFCAAFLEAAD